MSQRDVFAFYQRYREALDKAQRKGRTPTDVHRYIDAALVWTRIRAQHPEVLRLVGGAA